MVKVKKNQPKLLENIKNTISNTRSIDYHISEQIRRGRLEIRETFLYKRENNLAKGWESISSIVYVKRYVLSKDKEHKSESFYVSDLPVKDAKFMAEGIRNHWSIENKLHYTKDVIMREDKECTKNLTAAPNLGLLRSWSFNILKTANKSIKYACEMFQNYTIEELLKFILRT